METKTKKKFLVGDNLPGYSYLNHNGHTFHCKDISGMSFGRLFVLHLSDNQKPGNPLFWTCRCSCGSVLDINGSKIRDGRTQSCGCLSKEVSRKRMIIDYGEANFNHMMSSYKKSARHRQLEFSLSKEEFRQLTKGDCVYCGSPPLSVRNRSSSNGAYIFNGIDRVDNNVGYVIDNCVSCCSVCNKMKLNMIKEDFLSHVKRIYFHNI